MTTRLLEKTATTNPSRLKALQGSLDRALRSDGYRRKLAIDSAEEIAGIDDFRRLPFLTKDDLRRHSPFGLCCADEREIVRVHSTSGTTGDPVVIPYTAGDVETFTTLMARALTLAGMTDGDRAMVTPGYGLWTAGIGFQAGVERIGACAIPTGPIAMEMQMAFLRKMAPTFLIGTASMALLLGETIAREGIRPCLKGAVLGAEQWGEGRRAVIEDLLGARTYDIYGMTETYGPGIAIECPHQQGLHYWDDLFHFEVIDPVTGDVLPEGETGELVITTLVKEGLPLIRYRTRDLASILPGPCPCGSPYPRISRIAGRSDDMITYRGVNLFPSAIEALIAETDGLGSEFRIVLTTEGGKDCLDIEVERSCDGGDGPARELARKMKMTLSALPRVTLLPPQGLGREMKKTRRVYDHRTK
ncbi:MAG: phenylacetate--CoA ligase [Synergistaceae bacterium]|nr:phenylacetate--CoA ligase [Synergistaceae bacterium]